MGLTPADLARYNRHLLLPEIGALGQQKLKAARVLIVGAGGLGSPAALYLAAAGVGTLGLADGDRVDISNLQRQILFTTADVGQPKADVARQRLAALNGEIAVIAHAFELRAANILEVVERYDVVLDGSDRLTTRYLVNDACVILKKPLVSAAIHRFEGQAMTYVPDRGPCYRCLFPAAAQDIVPNCAQAGVLGVLPGVLGAIQATEAIKLIADIGEPLLGRLLTYDALALRFEEFTFKRRTDCAVCGENPSITAPQPESIRRISATELAALLGAPGGAAQYALIDVREPREFTAGHLPDSLNIPLASLEARFAQNPPAGIAVFICRSGVRSLQAGAIASRLGSSTPAHLEGGLLAWAESIDPSLKVIA